MNHNLGRALGTTGTALSSLATVGALATIQVPSLILQYIMLSLILLGGIMSAAGKFFDILLEQKTDKPKSLVSRLSFKIKS